VSDVEPTRKVHKEEELNEAVVGTKPGEGPQNEAEQVLRLLKILKKQSK
jgi:hypothetical protein